MFKILFVCHGNICRSTMAQFLFRHLAVTKGYTVSEDCREYADFYVDSAATSREEIGNPVDRRTVAKLKEHGIFCGHHSARQITVKDYQIFDLIIIMDRENQWGIQRILRDDPQDKVHFMLEYAAESKYKKPDGTAKDVSDPWYTHDFETTYRDLYDGCLGLLDHLASGNGKE